MNLLVVDDSKDITDVLMVYCESKGVECTVANAGIDGLEVIRNNSNFDLILMPFISRVQWQLEKRRLKLVSKECKFNTHFLSYTGAIEIFLIQLQHLAMVKLGYSDRYHFEFIAFTILRFKTMFLINLISPSLVSTSHLLNQYSAFALTQE